MQRGINTWRKQLPRVWVLLLCATLITWGTFALPVLADEAQPEDEVAIVDDEFSSEPLREEELEDDLSIQGDGGEAAIGSCVWSVSGSGALVIAPADGASGALPSREQLPVDGENHPVWLWSAEDDSITSIVVRDGVQATGDMRGLFNGLHNVVSMDLTGLDTSGVTKSDYFWPSGEMRTLAVGEKFVESDLVYGDDEDEDNYWCFPDGDWTAASTGEMLGRWEMPFGVAETYTRYTGEDGTKTSGTVRASYPDCSALQSEHNYANNANLTWTYTDNGAKRGLVVCFDGRSSIEYCDKLTVLDGSGKEVASYSSDELAGAELKLPNSTSFTIKLVSDEQDTAWGFRVASVTRLEDYVPFGFEGAEPLALGATVKGSEWNRTFKIELPSAGCVTVADTLSGSSWYIDYVLYDASGTKVWTGRPGDTYQRDGIDLKKGTYFFALEESYSYGSSPDYKLCLKFKAASESFPEDQNGSNNSMKTATHISVNKQYSAQLAVNDNVDYYRFSLSSPGYVDIDLSFFPRSPNGLVVHDASGKKVWSSDYTFDPDNNSAFHSRIGLTKGTYYVQIGDDEKNGYLDFQGSYYFKLSFSSVASTINEPQGGSNNTFKTATKLELGDSFKGFLAKNDTKDVYKITVDKKCAVHFSGTTDLDCDDFYDPQLDGRVQLYDSKGNIEGFSEIEYNETRKRWEYSGNDYIDVNRWSIDTFLTKGTHYLVFDYGGDAGFEPSISYSFNIGLSLGGTTVKGVKNKNYNGKAQKQKVKVYTGTTRLVEGRDYAVSYSNNKKIGKAKVIVTGKGKYAGKRTETFLIKRKQPMRAKLLKKRVSVSLASVAGNKQELASNIKVSKAKGKVTYKNVSGKQAKVLKVNAKTGKVTVPRGTARGTYTLKVKVTAKGNAKYHTKSKTFTYKIVVG